MLWFVFYCPCFSIKISSPRKLLSPPQPRRVCHPAFQAQAWSWNVLERMIFLPSWENSDRNGDVAVKGIQRQTGFEQAGKRVDRGAGCRCCLLTWAFSISGLFLLPRIVSDDLFTNPCFAPIQCFFSSPSSPLEKEIILPDLLSYL